MNERDKQLLNAVLLFHGREPWDDAHFAQWTLAIGEAKPTSEGLCAAIREALKNAGEEPGRPSRVEIAQAITAHLQKFEADPEINKDREYAVAGAKPALGRSVAVQYNINDGAALLHIEKALRYLGWLDAGNAGKHYDMPVEQTYRLALGVEALGALVRGEEVVLPAYPDARVTLTLADMPMEVMARAIREAMHRRAVNRLMDRPRPPGRGDKPAEPTETTAERREQMRAKALARADDMNRRRAEIAKRRGGADKKPDPKTPPATEEKT